MVLDPTTKVLVTGASGLVGAAVCDYLREYTTVIPCSRRPVDSGWVFYDALRPVNFDFSVDVIVHAASPASPDLFVAHPTETLMANVYGTQQLLEYAKRCCVKKFVYISSSEVYGRVSGRVGGFVETDFGGTDFLSVRSSYAIGKMAAEAVCIAYVSQFGLDVCIARLAHVYGPTCSKNDKRVSSAFPWLAARGKNLVLKSSGSQVRNYTYSADCARAIRTIIEQGSRGEAYNVASRCGKCSIREMAEIVAAVGGVELLFEQASDEEVCSFNPMADSCLDPSKLENLGWSGTTSPQKGFSDTVIEIRKRIMENCE